MGKIVVGTWQLAVKQLQEGTKDPANCPDKTVYGSVMNLVLKLNELPTPKSAWKKLVQQLQVPLHVGNAFSTAAQHSRKSSATHAALVVLQVLLSTAAASGVIKEGAAPGNLAISMRQQLQHAGVPQHLAAIMTATAADLRSEAAALGGLSGEEELCSELGRFSTSFAVGSRDTQAQVALPVICLLNPNLRRLWGSQGETHTANCIAWLCDPSGHAEAAMQLCIAALQHISSVLQHMLPAVQQRAPQQAAALLVEQHDVTAAVVELGYDLVDALASTQQSYPTTFKQQRQSGSVTLFKQEQERLQHLLPSPQCLPCVAALLVLTAFRVSRSCSQQAASGSEGPQGTSAGVSSSSSSNSTGGRGRGGSDRGRDSGSVTRQQGRQQQQRPAGGNSSSGVAVGSKTPTPCQLKLLELLGLAPQLAEMVEQLSSISEAWLSLPASLTACERCFCFVDDLTSTPAGQQAEVDQQRWRFEQQLWQLLPSVLLPCASNIVSAAGTIKDPSWQERDESCEWLIYNSSSALFSRQHMVDLCGEGLLPDSGRALYASCKLHSWLEGGRTDYRLPHPAWMEEVLDGVLQLADQLLLQQQASAAPVANAAGNSQRASSSTPAAANTSKSSSSSTSTDRAVQSGTWAVCAAHSLRLLTSLAYESHRWVVSCSSTAASPPRDLISGGPDAAAASATPSPPPVAERFVEFCTALNAALRFQSLERLRATATTAEQRRNPIQPPAIADCLRGLLLDLDDAVETFRSPLALHMGLCGPAALAREQRQFYSLLSTVQKLGRWPAGTAHELCWGQQVAAKCCWAAAQAAVGLLQAMPATSSEAAAAEPSPAACGQAQDTPAAVLQQPEVEYLPSLVIFGRCCLVWAEQLHQQIPEVLQLLASGAEAQQQEQRQQGGGQATHGAAHVCIPGWQQGAAAVTPPPRGLEGLVATVSSWVGGVTSPAAHTALAAAAGGLGLQKFRQPLEALSASQQAVREELSDASLTALVQQLRATGEILSSIAVPHFCNNPACVNISGPTDVLLVSGRSCLCAGCCTARYCGRGCQRQAWPRHKPVCKAAAAIAVTAGAQA